MKDSSRRTKLNNETVGQIGDIVGSLEKDAIRIERQDQGQLLRNALSEFVVSQIESVNKRERFLDVITQELESKVKGGTVDVKDLLEIVKIYSSNKTSQVSAILAPFIPSTSAPSPLLPPAVDKVDHQSDFEKAIGSYSTEELAILDKAYRQVREIKGEK